jgi:hypothetical protein
MNVDNAITQLEVEWETNGFLGKLRTGIFEKEGCERVEKILESIDLERKTSIDRRLVALTWYMPMFMTWQIERVQEQGGQVRELKKALNQIHGALEKILDIP